MSLTFDSFNISWGRSFCIEVIRYSLGFVKFYILFLPHIWEVLTYFFFKWMLLYYLLPFSFWDTHYLNFSLFKSWVVLILFLHFFRFSFSCFMWVTARVLPLNSLILSSTWSFLFTMLSMHYSSHFGGFFNLIIWYFFFFFFRDSQVPQWSRIHLPMQETQEMQVRSLGQEDPLE